MFRDIFENGSFSKQELIVFIMTVHFVGSGSRGSSFSIIFYKSFVGFCCNNLRCFGIDFSSSSLMSLSEFTERFIEN